MKPVLTFSASKGIKSKSQASRIMNLFFLLFLLLPFFRCSLVAFIFFNTHLVYYTTGFLEYESVKDNLIKYKCLSCNKDYSNKLDEKFKNTFKFSNNDNNKSILLLRKGVYPYECMDDWEKFNERTLPKK